MPSEACSGTVCLADVLMAAPVFIVNTGRCGSTMLAEMMAHNPRWLVLSEYLSYLASGALSRRVLSGETYWRLLSTQSPVLREMHLAGQKQPEVLYEEGLHGPWPLHEAPSIMLATLPALGGAPMSYFRALEAAIRPRPRAPLAELMEAVFRCLSAETGRDIWIERTGDSLLLTGRLRHVFPQSRFVHLHRDGRDVAISMRGKPDFRAKVSYFQSLHAIGLSPYKTHFAYGVARWHEWIETVGSKLLDVRHFTDAKVDLAMCARHWARMIDAGQHMLADMAPPGMLSLSYAHLANEPEAALRSLAEFIEPGGDLSWVSGAARLSTGATSTWRSVGADDRAAMEAMCTPQLRLLGYSVD